MPKYFTDERPLLFRKVALKPSELSVARLSTLFDEYKQYTICITFDGFEADCLGFVVHVRKNGSRFELLNIAEEAELVVPAEEQLVEILNHVSGIKYSDRAQREFQRIRNDIGSAVGVSAFSGSA